MNPNTEEPGSSGFPTGIHMVLVWLWVLAADMTDRETAMVGFS